MEYTSDVVKILTNLKQEGFNAQVTESTNGQYLIKCDGVFSLYVPKNYDINSKMYTYYPGADGIGKDGSTLRDDVLNNNTDKIVLLNDAGASHVLNYVPAVEKALSTSGIKTSSDVYMGFSAGASVAIQQASKDISNNPNESQRTVVLLDSGYNGDQIFSNNYGYEKDFVLKNLKENNSTVILVEENSNVWQTSENYRVLGDAGIPVIVAECANPTDHRGVNDTAIKNDILGLINGNSDAMINSGMFIFKKYDTVTKQYVVITPEVFKDIASLGKKTGKIKYDAKYMQSAINSSKKLENLGSAFSGVIGKILSKSTHVKNVNLGKLNIKFNDISSQTRGLSNLSNVLCSINDKMDGLNDNAISSMTNLNLKIDGVNKSDSNATPISQTSSIVTGAIASTVSTLASNQNGGATPTKVNQTVGGTPTKVNQTVGGTPTKVNQTVGGTPIKVNQTVGGTPTKVNQTTNNSLGILPSNNKFSNKIPNIDSGCLGTMEISQFGVSYYIYEIKNDTYDTYINKLMNAGFKLDSSGSYIKDDYLVTVIRNSDNTDLSISVNQTSATGV